MVQTRHVMRRIGKNSENHQSKQLAIVSGFITVSTGTWEGRVGHYTVMFSKTGSVLKENAEESSYVYEATRETKWGEEERHRLHPLPPTQCYQNVDRDIACIRFNSETSQQKMFRSNMLDCRIINPLKSSGTTAHVWALASSVLRFLKHTQLDTW